MTTPNVNLDEWSGPQDQPWTTVNGAMHVIDALMPHTVVSNTLTTPPASPAAGACYIVAATATDAWAGWDGKIAAYIGGTWVQIAPQEGWVFWVLSASGRSVYTGGAWVPLIEEAPIDGTAYARQDGAWVVVSVTGGASDFGFSYGGSPTASEVVGFITLARATTCPANFAGSAGNVGVNPTASFSIDVQANAVSIGTITIATDGSFTFATTGGAQQVIAAGSKITFVAPAGVDATIADIALTLIGNV